MTITRDSLRGIKSGNQDDVQLLEDNDAFEEPRVVDVVKDVERLPLSEYLPKSNWPIYIRGTGPKWFVSVAHTGFHIKRSIIEAETADQAKSLFVKANRAETERLIDKAEGDDTVFSRHLPPDIKKARTRALKGQYNRSLKEKHRITAVPFEQERARTHGYYEMLHQRTVDRAKAAAAKSDIQALITELKNAVTDK